MKGQDHLSSRPWQDSVQAAAENWEHGKGRPAYREAVSGHRQVKGLQVKDHSLNLPDSGFQRMWVDHRPLPQQSSKPTPCTQQPILPMCGLWLPQAGPAHDSLSPEAQQSAACVTSIIICRPSPPCDHKPVQLPVVSSKEEW